MKAKWVALALAGLCAAYLVAAALRAWALLTSGEWQGALLGVGVLLVPLLVGWAVVRELRFGQLTESMANELEAAGGLPVDDIPRTPSGRIDREAARETFERYRAEVDEAPGEWDRWFRLSCAYDAAGDRRRARAAMRHAAGLRRGS